MPASVSVLVCETETITLLTPSPQPLKARHDTIKLSGPTVKELILCFCRKTWMKMMKETRSVSLETLQQGNLRQHSSCKCGLNRFQTPLFFPPLLKTQPL